MKSSRLTWQSFSMRP